MNFKLKNHKNKLFPVFVFFILLIAYLKTLLPTVSFWDTGEFQTIPYTLDIGHPTGYPTYIIFGKIFISLVPISSVAWKMNFFSALLVASGCALLTITIYSLTKNRLLSVFTVLLLGFTKIIWEIAIRAEVHSLHFFFVCIFLFLTTKVIYFKKTKLLPLLSFTTALSLGNHLLSVFFIPLLSLNFIFCLKTSKNAFLKLFFKSFFLFILGLSIYLFLPLTALKKPPLTFDYNVATWDGFLRHIGGKDFRHLMASWTKNSFLETWNYYLNFLKNLLPVWGLFITIIGIIKGLKTKTFLHLLFGILFISTILFSLRYQNASLERYFITSLILIIIWFTTGLDLIMTVFEKGLKKLFKNSPTIFINILFSMFIIILVVNKIKINLPKVDQSKNFSGLNYALETLNNIEKNGVIISWWSYSTPLWYLQKVEQYRPDIKIYNLSHYQWEDTILKNINKYPVYLIENFNLTSSNLDLKKTGNIYKVIKTNEHL
ncbi:protein O-mannosyl-transferase family [Patescibacteria group bacterium]